MGHLKDEALDKAKCSEAIDIALVTPEPEQAFDRHARLLAKTKKQLKTKRQAAMSEYRFSEIAERDLAGMYEYGFWEFGEHQVE